MLCPISPEHKQLNFQGDWATNLLFYCPCGEMADTLDSKSSAIRGVQVQVLSGAPSLGGGTACTGDLKSPACEGLRVRISPWAQI